MVIRPPRELEAKTRARKMRMTLECKLRGPAVEIVSLRAPTTQFRTVLEEVLAGAEIHRRSTGSTGL